MLWIKHEKKSSLLSVCMCVCPRWCYVCFTLVFILASINVLWRMNFSEHKYITHANRMPTPIFGSLPYVWLYLNEKSKKEVNMFYTSTTYSYALSKCTNSYIHFISYLCTVAVVTHRMLLYRPVSCDHECVWFIFQFKYF